jgi:hypothetical protein
VDLDHIRDLKICSIVQLAIVMSALTEAIGLSRKLYSSACRAACSTIFSAVTGPPRITRTASSGGGSFRMNGSMG